jgi:hypothetical protein
LSEYEEADEGLDGQKKKMKRKRFAQNKCAREKE